MLVMYHRGNVTTNFLKIKLNFRKLSSNTPDPQTVIYKKKIQSQLFKITKITETTQIDQNALDTGCDC